MRFLSMVALFSIALTGAVFVHPAEAAGKKARVKWAPLHGEPPPYKKPRPASAELTQAPARVETAAPTIPEPSAPVPQSQTAVASAPMARTGQLDLTCLGGGTANKLAVARVKSNAYVSGTVGMAPYSGSSYGTSTITGSRQQGFADQVDIRLFGGDDRIRMPRTMLPLIRGGKDGWFKLKDVVADARSIRASAAVNFINNPKVHIDRVTGTISISGKAGDYVGQCEVIDAAAPAKF